MKILYVAQQYDYGDPARGLSFEHCNFYDSLKNMDHGTHEIVYFPFDQVAGRLGVAQMNERLLETAFREKPNLCFFFLVSDVVSKETVQNITASGLVTCNWFADDHWRFDNFSKYWAPVFTFAITTDADAFLKYQKNSQKNIIKSQWGVNHFFYKKSDLSKKYDVTFVGQPHSGRKRLVGQLKKAGIAVECFGRGWPNGRVSQQEMINIFNQSKINLNFSNASGQINATSVAKVFFKKDARGRVLLESPARWLKNAKSVVSAITKHQIKARNFEITGCGGFLLTGYASHLEDYYVIGKEIVCFTDTDSLVKKIRHYLSNDSERQSIAMAGYERTIRTHTYQQRFKEIFKTMGLLT